MNILLLILAFAAIAAYEIPEIVRKREWKELVVFSVLLLIGFTVSFFQTIGVKVPNPVKGIELIVKKIANLLL
ncbi:MAG: hypothetical protein IMW97_03660 [Firmicutes bacterium]|nr:hypothetical protein [Candidatus Fermentithermobacillaceae bacterium]